MNLRRYLQLLHKHRYLLLAGILIGIGVGAYTVATSQKSYRGGVAFFVSSTGEGTVAAANAGDQFALRRVNSYLALLNTDRLGEMIADDTGLDLSPTAIRNKIAGSADLNTVLLTARVRDRNRDQALLITEALARQFPELVSTVERPADGQETVRLEVVSGPSVRVVPIQMRFILVTRALAGLILAMGLAALRELLDNRLHSIDQAVMLSKAPLLGLITNDRHAPDAPLILDDALASVRAEEYRQVRTSLQFVDVQDRAKVIVVTSSVPSEGKSVTASNLALSIARSGQRVVIIDADLRKPMVGKLFGLEQSVGLTDVLRGHVAREDVLQWWGDTELAVLPSGVATSNPSELLGTVATSRLISELRMRFDTIIIDSPPLVPVTDAAILSTLADGVVLIVRPDKVTRPQFERALGHLERVRANVLGLVGSMMSERSSSYSGSYAYGEPPPEEVPTPGPPDAAGTSVPVARTHRRGLETDGQRGSKLDEVLQDAESRLSRRRATPGSSAPRKP